MRWIYISPHFDDFVFSAGGIIYEQTRVGTPVEIWTIMGGFPDKADLTDFAKIMYKTWGMSSTEETARIRRAENEKAASIVGAKTVNFDFLDCIYRRGLHGEALYQRLFDPPHADETELPVEIANTISKRLQPDDVLVCQLAIGGHVDHVTVRKALEILGHSMLYIADIPYLLNKPQNLRPKTAGMKELVKAISEAGLISWLEAIRGYQSQVEPEFKGPELMQKRMSAYWAERRGIRFWKVK